MSSVYDPAGGTLHDLAALLTRWAVGTTDDSWAGLYEMLTVVVSSANKEYGKKVDVNALATEALFDFPDGYNRREIQLNLNRVRRWYR